MAEGVGFEPTEAFTSHAFQACRFGRSRTLPYVFTYVFTSDVRLATDSLSSAASEVPVGSCATSARKSGQGRKAAASIGTRRVPQIAWPSPQSLFFVRAPIWG